MREIGTFEAKTHLSALLEEVARGETIVITKRGRVVARLTPPEEPDRRNRYCRGQDPAWLAQARRMGDNRGNSSDAQRRSTVKAPVLDNVPFKKLAWVLRDGPSSAESHAARSRVAEASAGGVRSRRALVA